MNLGFIKYIFLALLMGVATIMYLLDHDPAFSRYVEEHVQRIFLNSFKSVLKGKVKHVWLLTGEIELENVTVTSPYDDSWYWQAEQFVLHFSWLSLVLKGKIDVSVSLHNLESQSLLTGNDIAIVDHLKSFIAGAAGFPATLKMLTITKGHFALDALERALHYETFFNGTYGNITGWLRLHLNIDEGAVWCSQRKICDNFSGALHVSIPDYHNNIVDASISGKLVIPQLPSGKNIGHFDGQWHADSGQFLLHTLDNACAFTLYNWIKTPTAFTGDLSCTLPLNYLNYFVPSIEKLQLEGTGHCQAHIELSNDYALDGTISLNNFNSCGYDLGMPHITINRSQGIWQGVFGSFYSNLICQDLQGDFSYNEHTKHAQTQMHNAMLVKVNNDWSIDPEACFVNFTMTDGVGTGSYSCTLNNTTAKNMHHTDGNLYLNNNLFSILGNFNAKKYEVEVQCNPYPLLQSFKLFEKTKPNVLLHATLDNGLEGTVDFGFLQEITKNLFNYKIPGQGTLFIKGHLDGTRIKASVGLLEGGNIRIPETYTIIRGIKGMVEADLATKNIIIHDSFLALDKGSLVCNRAVIQLNNKGMPTYVYAPCTIKKAFLTIQKELFAVFSGAILWMQTEGKGSALKGKIVVDRGYFKKNIFAQLGGPQGMGFGAGARTNFDEQCHLDITLETKNALEVKTSFLETQLQIGIGLQGTLENPELSGSIGLENGTLAFPYRPLTITHGTIYFLPHQLYDPIVELIAKGKIRKYQVTLRCNGSLQHPNISFESTPPLTEEQVITLLVAGSEEGSLSLAMPALIMQKLQNVIFGPEQPASKLEGYFKSLIEPLKHIRFIPAFSDQSGRGGFRGSIEIDVNDQLRAMIQKNFSLSEDTKLEVEYFLSDDITVRGMRDERGDFGGEVEMRWKF